MSVESQNEGGLLEMKIFWFLGAHPMLGADTASLGSDLLEEEGVLELLFLFEDDVDVKVAIPNVSVAHNCGASDCPQLLDSFYPVLDVEGNVVAECLAHFNRSNSDVLPDLPYLGELLVAVGHDGIFEVSQFLSHSVHFLSGAFHKQQVVLLLH